MYALVLSLKERPELRIIEKAHRLVLETLVEALRPKVADLHRQGISDLALGEYKCSGNSLRIKRTHLLYHGTLLYDFPLGLIEECLAMPRRQPAYRCDRPHREFVANLPLSAAVLRRGPWCLGWLGTSGRLAAQPYRPTRRRKVPAA